MKHGLWLYKNHEILISINFIITQNYFQFFLKMLILFIILIEIGVLFHN